MQPFGSWAEHIGGRFREHTALEIIYDGFALSTCRTWSPRALFQSIGSQTLFSQALKKSKGEPATRRPQSIATPDETKKIYFAFHSLYTLFDHNMTRSCHKIIHFLYSCNHLQGFTVQDMATLKSLDIIGSRVMYYELSKPLLECFPAADSGQLSAIHHVSFDPYNLESAYNILDLQSIFDESCSESHKTKAFALRVLFADLSLLINGSVQRGICIQQLAEIAIKCLSLQILNEKLTEYCTRADTVWRKYLDGDGVEVSK